MIATLIGLVVGLVIAAALIVVVGRALGPDPHADLERRIMARRRAWEQFDMERGER